MDSNGDACEFYAAIPAPANFEALVDAKQAHVAELEAEHAALLAGKAKDKAAAELTREHAELVHLKDRERSASLVSEYGCFATAQMTRNFAVNGVSAHEACTATCSNFCGEKCAVYLCIDLPSKPF